MSETFRTTLSGIGIALAVVSYIPYVRDTLRGVTRPHTFSWLIWALVTAIGFAAQQHEKSGEGSWVTGVVSAECTFIFLLSLRLGERQITRSDWIFVTAALVAIPLWMVADTPLYSVILAAIIDVFAFAPTFRKAYHRPGEETLSTYLTATVIWASSLFALQRFNAASILIPLCGLLLNGAFCLMLQVRRRQIEKA